MASNVQITAPPKSGVSVNAFYGQTDGVDNFGSFRWEIPNPANNVPIFRVLSHGRVYRVPQLQALETVTIFPHYFSVPNVCFHFDSSENPRLGGGGVTLWRNPVVRPVERSYTQKSINPYDAYGPFYQISDTFRNGGFDQAGSFPAPFAIWNTTVNGASTITRDIFLTYTYDLLFPGASCQFTQDAGGNSAMLWQEIPGAGRARGRRYRLSFTAYNAGAADIPLRVDLGDGEIVVLIRNGARWNNYSFEITSGQAANGILTNAVLRFIAVGTPGAVFNLDEVFLEDISSEPRNNMLTIDTAPRTFPIPNDFFYFRIYTNTADNANPEAAVSLPFGDQYFYRFPGGSPNAPGNVVIPPNVESLMFYGW